MRERGISRSDVRTVLSRCWVSRIELYPQGFRWTAEGKDLDGRSLQIVIRAMTADNEPVTVITVIALQEENDDECRAIRVQSLTRLSG